MESQVYETPDDIIHGSGSRVRTPVAFGVSLLGDSWQIGENETDDFDLADPGGGTAGGSSETR